MILTQVSRQQLLYKKHLDDIEMFFCSSFFILEWLINWWQDENIAFIKKASYHRSDISKFIFMTVSPSQKLDESIRSAASPVVPAHSSYSRTLFFSGLLFVVVLAGSVGLYFMNSFSQKDIVALTTDNQNIDADIAAIQQDHIVQGAMIYEKNAKKIDTLIADNNPVRIMDLVSALEAQYSVTTKWFNYNDGRVSTTITATNLGATEGDALTRVIAFIAAFRTQTSPLAPNSGTGAVLNPAGVLKLQPISSVAGNNETRSFSVEFLTR